MITSFFPVLQILGIADFTGDQLAILGAFITNAVTVTALLLKHGQQAGPGA